MGGIPFLESHSLYPAEVMKVSIKDQYAAAVYVPRGRNGNKQKAEEIKR